MDTLARLLRRLPWKEVKTLFLLFAVVCVAYEAQFLRARGVRRLPLDHDERYYLFAGRDYARSFQEGDLGRIPRSEIVFEHPAFAKLVYGTALYLAHDELPFFEKEGFFIGERLSSDHPAKPLLRTARTVSAWFGVLTTAVLAAVNPLAGFFLAVHSFAVKYTSVAYLEAIPSLFSLLSVLAYSRWDRLHQDPAPKTRPRQFWSEGLWLVLSAVTLGISVASKYIYGVAGIAIALHAIGRALSRRKALVGTLLPMAVWGVVALLAFFIADPALWPDPVHRLQASFAFSAAFSSGEYVRSMGYPAWQPFIWLSRPVTGHDPRAIPYLPGDFLVTLDVPINLLALLGIHRLLKRHSVFAVWLITAAGFLLLWQTKWPQYVMILLVPLCLSAAEGILTILAWLARGVRRLFSVPGPAGRRA